MEGEYVLLYLDQRRTYLVKVEAGKTFHTHKGFIKLDDLIGREYGSTVSSSLGVPFTVLKPLLRDYIMKSVRRTQIMYPKDIALIIVFSGIGPGSRVVEAGTGTGALTTALAHFVRPDGRVHSYEVRSEFLETAKKNIKRAGLADLVELKNKDITAGIDEEDVDSVILDMATPWLVVSHAYQALKPCGTIVSFSPTIDQVVKTVEALRENGFIDIETIECLMRGMQTERGKTRPQTLMTAHTGYITFARKALKQPPKKEKQNC
ncbi:MAG: tRNA (adenine-N1)-methyltransferase [Candidatus Bathyarchaeia archaeon]|nr:tRNA (adenine-N1)-methyltransferase [Candidatus Bathyarchaeota archaeon]